MTDKKMAELQNLVRRNKILDSERVRNNERIESLIAGEGVEVRTSSRKAQKDLEIELTVKSRINKIRDRAKNNTTNRA